MQEKTPSNARTTSMLVVHIDITDRPDLETLQTLTKTNRVEQLGDQLGLVDAPVLRAWGVEVSEQSIDRRLHDRHLLELDLGVRAYNVLDRAGIKTIGDLVEKTEEEISRIRSIGEPTVAEIKDALARQGLQLASVPKSTPTDPRTA